MDPSPERIDLAWYQVRYEDMPVVIGTVLAGRQRDNSRGLIASSVSNNSNSTKVAFLEYTLKLTPPG